MEQKKRIKIALLGTFPPVKGGIATNLRNLLDSPLQNSFELIPYQTMSRKQGTVDYFSEKIPIKIFRVIRDLSCFVRLLSCHHPRIIHINSSFGSWSFWRDLCYLLLSKMFKKKVLMQYHGGNIDEFLSHFSVSTGRILIRILQLSDRIAVCSTAQQYSFIKTGLWEKTVVLPNTVKINRYLGRKDLRVQFSIPEKAFVVLFVSAQFFRQKGILELLDAISLLHERNLNPLLILVGGGSDDEQLESRIRTEAAQGNISLTGHLNPDDLQRLMVSSDVLILPSYSEGLPLTILEAMASSLPVIATPVGGIPDLVEDGENGFIVPVGDSSMLAEKTICLMSKPVLRKKMGKNNVSKIAENYNPIVISRLYSVIYNQMIQGTPNAD